MSKEYVKSTTTSGITTIEFFHPSHNSLPSHVLKELAESIIQAGSNNDTRVIILQSGGDRTFCAGASFDEMLAIDNFEKGKAFFMGFANVINACRTCPKLIIGRVQGKAVGGGVGVASAVDYCMATKYASVKLSELAVGIGPFVVGPAVERKIGKGAFSQMSINAWDWLSANWAKENNLFADVFESTEELDKAVLQMATRLSKSNPDATREIKNILWEGTGHWDTLLEQRAEKSGRLILTDFAKEFIQSFKNKA